MKSPGAGAVGALPRLLVAAGVLTLGLATAGMLRGVEPFATWYYPFAWYSTLLVLDGLIALRGGPGRDGASRFLLLGRPAHLLTLLGWSLVLWLFFELLNFRLRNWYYVFVPRESVARWAGVTLSFATVLPAVFALEALLGSLGVARRLRWPTLGVTPRLTVWLQLVGALLLPLPLLWPDRFFPLVWIGPTLLLDPWNYRRAPARSLLGDLEAGRPGRPLRLLLGGAFIGLLWELFNVRARGKWIYTVPGFEELKLFEMPVLGFLGFPPFALECFAIWQALVLVGVAVPRAGRPHPASASLRAVAIAGALLFSVAVLLGMEARTISSFSPRLADLPGIPAERLDRAGYDVFSLARATPGEVLAAIDPPADGEPASGRARLGEAERAPVTDEVQGPRGADEMEHPRAVDQLEGERAVDEEDARRWIETARLAALRGIGAENVRRLEAVGVRSLRELAAADPARLSTALASLAKEEVVPGRVRVWVRAAREENAAGR